MPSRVLSDLKCATRNMSVPVMAALLGQIYSRLSEHEDLSEAAVHVQEALVLILSAQEEAVEDDGERLQ